MERGLWCVLLEPQRGSGSFQRPDEERPKVPAIHPAVFREPPLEKEGGAGMHPFRHHADHQIPPPHRATHQNGQRQTRRPRALETSS